MDELLNCCPKCGSTLEFSNLMQYSDVYKITRSGKLSKKRIRKKIAGLWSADIFHALIAIL